MTTATTKRTYDHVELSSESFWAQSARERDKSFAILRSQRPVSWQPPAYGSLMPDASDPGYWAVVRHQDIIAVSRANKIFSSAPELGGVMFENVPAEVLIASQSILTMDEPQHAITRRLVVKAFSPRQIRLIEEQINRQARVIVDDFLADGPRDFVEQVSMRLPLWTISEMLGVPVEERDRLVKAVDDMVGYNDPEYIGDRDPFACVMGGLMALHDIAQKLIEARRAAPAEDLMTALVSAEVDGHRLSDEELRSYFCLLAIAGNDTTRNTTSHGIKALYDHPDQKDLLRNDFDRMIPTAIEEFLRWGTAVMTFRRTAREDTVIGGQEISAGEKVVMFYSSGNRDETVFEDPWRFDITRNPNPHIAFGGGGVHFCLGNHVARMQMRALFREIVTRAPELKLGEPEYVTGHFMHAIKRMPCSL
ncbi:cytochrome P450 [Skermania sp. ID1734]|uniref:cytochrome P450 n=1 Tax=Skermania sp. ID1734 TaxID=2597516 RepID=UPI00117CACA5|nr:cytochrome P450 [Skermania sp. ID1734]TSE01134.1 cytochrome P450 [Skermania sp. ID1734]